MTCKDNCFFYNVCELKNNHYFIGKPIGEINEVEIGCHRFLDKSRVIVLDKDNKEITDGMLREQEFWRFKNREDVTYWKA